MWGFFFPYSRWIVWFQFKLLVCISQLCTTLSNLFLLGISIWNEALLSLIYLKQPSVPTWWLNRNWLSSKKMSSKFRKNAWDTRSRQNQNPQQRCRWYFIIWCYRRQYKAEYNWDIHTNSFGYRRQKKKMNWLKIQNSSCSYYSLSTLFQWLYLVFRIKVKLLSQTLKFSMSWTFLSFHPYLVTHCFTVSTVALF